MRMGGGGGEDGFDRNVFYDFTRRERWANVAFMNISGSFMNI